MLGRREEKQGKPIRRPRPDANVQRLVRTEMRVKEAQDGLSDRLRAEAQAQWATMHATSTNSEVDRRLKAACDEELRLENQHLVMVRRAKLKQLYASDRVKWEKALARAGLAICYDD